jgi:hypothetical protein
VRSRDSAKNGIWRTRRAAVKSFGFDRSGSLPALRLRTGHSEMDIGTQIPPNPTRLKQPVPWAERERAVTARKGCDMADPTGSTEASVPLTEHPALAAGADPLACKEVEEQIVKFGRRLHICHVTDARYGDPVGTFNARR